MRNICVTFLCVWSVFHCCCFFLFWKLHLSFDSLRPFPPLFFFCQLFCYDYSKFRFCLSYFENISCRSFVVLKKISESVVPLKSFSIDLKRSSEILSILSIGHKLIIYNDLLTDVKLI